VKKSDFQEGILHQEDCFLKYFLSTAYSLIPTSSLGCPILFYQNTLTSPVLILAFV